MRWLVIMAKEPRAGAVKTRLAREIGAVGACAFYRRTLRTVVRRLTRDPRWRLLLAVTPDVSRASGIWPGGVLRVPQGRGDLGKRMQRLFDRLPPGPAVIIGSDIPDIRAADIARAFRRLGRGDAVLGEDGGGGYWLIGLKRSPRVLRPFAGVRWSSPHSFEDTARNLGRHRVVRANRIEDVDEGVDYRRLGGAGARVVPPGFARD